MKQTLKVWRLTEFNCIRLHATLGWGGWLRLGSGLWLGRAALSSSGARMMVGDNLLMDEHDNHSMVTETYLQDTLSAQFKTSQKATNTGFTPALTYSKLQIFFSFFEENKKKIKTDWALHTGFAKKRHVPLLAPGIVCVVWVWQRRWKPLQCSVRNATLVTQGSEAVLSFSRMH